MRERLYLSTIDPQAGELARRHGLGLEIAEYCTAFNMDDLFDETDERVRREIAGIDRRLFHGPFNELFPCAVDPLARKLAAQRFDQALTLAQSYGARKLILHGGYNPRLYFSCWYVEQSALFWKEFLEKHPGEYEICLENVLEDEPGMLPDIVRQVNDPRLRLCLDVGHVNAYSPVPALEWIDCWGESLSHCHIHYNDGTADTHSALDAGTLNMEKILRVVETATVTLELPQIGNAVEWLKCAGLLK